MLRIPTIKTKYLGPTNTKGSRMKATRVGYHNKSIIIPFNYEHDNYENHQTVMRELIARYFPEFINSPVCASDRIDQGFVFLIDIRGY